MGATPVYTLRYPEPLEAANGPLAFQNLADDVEEALTETDGNVSTLSGTVSSLSSTVSGLSSTVPNLPKGLIAIQRRATATASVSNNTTEQQVMRLPFSVSDGRTYRIGLRGLTVTATAACSIQVRFRATTNGTTPGTSSTQIAIKTVQFAAAGEQALDLDLPYIPNANQSMNVLVTIQRSTSGTLNFNATAAEAFLLAEDIGLEMAYTGTNI